MAKATIDNCRAGRADKGANPVAKFIKKYCNSTISMI